MDLLSVLLHEYGHALGLEHSPDAHALMSTTLQPGTRRLPSAEELDLMAGLLDIAKETGTASPVPYDPFSPPGTPLPMTISLAAFIATRQRRSTLSSAIPQYAVAANPQLTNPQFADSQGWSSTGDVTFTNNTATLAETATTQTRLNQVFKLGPNDRYLSFTLSGISLDDVSNSPDDDQRKSLWDDQRQSPRDAFEVALINPNTGRLIVSPLADEPALLITEGAVVGTAGEAESDLYSADWPVATAWVLGAEGEGMRRLTREICDQLLRNTAPPSLR